MAKDFTRYSRAVTRTPRWKALRHEILERDGWTCACGCGRRGRLEIDHIQPVRLRPDLAFDPANLQALAPECHTRKTRIECGHTPQSPEREAWGNAVAALAAKSNPAT